MIRPNLSCMMATVLVVAISWSTKTTAAEPGNVVLRVTTLPATNAGSVRFAGTPAGQLRLAANGTASLQAGVETGRHVSRLEWIDPALLSAGYRLTAISCDDRSSQRRSEGDVPTKAATFNVEAGETVTCTFQLAIRMACTCPDEGRWKVANHTGSMACTGAMSMTLPLIASRSQGTLKANETCDTIVADGMSEDEADVVMHLQRNCSYVGTVGGSRDGIPMTIEFKWNVESERRITGDLTSNVSTNGMTCRMSRTYELDYMQ